MIYQAQFDPLVPQEHEWEVLMRSCYYLDVYSDRPVQGAVIPGRTGTHSLVRWPDGFGVITMRHLPIVDGRLQVPPGMIMTVSEHPDLVYGTGAQELPSDGDSTVTAGMVMLSVVMLLSSLFWAAMWLLVF